MTLADEYPTTIRGSLYTVVIECYADIAYIVDTYKLIYIRSKLKKDGSQIAKFRNQ